MSGHASFQHTSLTGTTKSSTHWGIPNTQVNPDSCLPKGYVTSPAMQADTGSLVFHTTKGSEPHRSFRGNHNTGNNVKDGDSNSPA